MIGMQTPNPSSPLPYNAYSVSIAVNGVVLDKAATSAAPGMIQAGAQHNIAQSHAQAHPPLFALQTQREQHNHICSNYYPSRNKKRKDIDTPTDDHYIRRQRTPKFRRVDSTSASTPRTPTVRYAFNIWDRVPHDAIMLILEFHSFRMCDFINNSGDDTPSLCFLREQSIKTLYGYFANDPSRSIRVLFPHLDLSCAILSWVTKTEHTRIYGSVIPRSGYVTTLDLSNNMLTDSSLLEIFNVPAHSCKDSDYIERYLSKLDLSYNILLSGASLNPWLLQCMNLQALDLSSTGVGWSLIQSVLSTKAMSGLQKIGLRSLREQIGDDEILSIPAGRWALLSDIDLSYNKISDVGAVHVFGASSIKGSKMKKINLAKNNLSHFILHGDTVCINLSYLNLSMNSLSLDTIRSLSNSVRVKELHLYRCDLDTEKMLQVCEMSSIQHLDVSDNEQLSDPSCMRNLHQLEQLAVLCLNGIRIATSSSSSCNNISATERLQAVANITSVRTLQRLELESCQLDDWSCKLLLLTLPPHLSHLIISRNNFTDQCLTPVMSTNNGAVESCTLRTNTTSMTLDMSHNYGIGDHVAALISLYFPNTVHLDVSHCQIGTTGAARIISSLKYLESINLRANNDIGDAAVLPLVVRSDNTNCTLKHIDLSKNNITDSGAYLLITRNRVLTSIDLRENSISDRIVQFTNRIDELSCLCRLDLSYNSMITERGRAELYQNVPESIDEFICE